MKPLQAAQGLKDLVQGLEIDLVPKSKELVYALPLTGYMFAIACLFAWLVPSALRKVDRTSIGSRTWEIKGLKTIEARLLRVKHDSVWLQSSDAVMNPPLSAFSDKDRAHLSGRTAEAAGSVQHSRVFLLLSFLSFALTWTYMLQYFALSLATYASGQVQRRIAASPFSALTMLAKPEALQSIPLLWLRDVSLFDEAWSWVCARPARWLLSSQICVFTTAFFTPLIVTSRVGERRTQGLATMLLGQMVAISTATGLLLRLPCRPAAQLSALIWPGLLGATFLSGLLPRTTGSVWFLPVLLGLHVSLFVPLLPIHRRPRDQLHLPYLFGGVACMALFIHLEALRSAIADSDLMDRVPFPAHDSIPGWSSAAGWKTLVSVHAAFRAHPAQASIGSDAVCCAVLFVLFMFVDGRRTPGAHSWLIPVVLSSLVPFVGLGVTGGLYMVVRESRILRELKLLGEL